MYNIRYFVKHSAFRFFSSTFLAIPVSILTGFFTFKYIDPQHIGLWNKILLVEVYTAFLGFGIVNGLGRELPLLLGMNKNAEAEKMIQTSLFTTIITQIIILIFGIFYLFFSNNDSDTNIAVSFLIARLIMSVYNGYLTSTFRSDSQFNKLSNIMFVVLLLRMFLAPLSMYGFLGFLFYDFGVSFINCLLLHKVRPFKLVPKFNVNVFYSLFKIGFPLFLAAYLVTFFDSFFRQYLVYFSTNYKMGLYASVLVLLNTLSILPNTISTYLYPKLSFNFGKTGDIDAAWRILLRVYFIVIISISLLDVLGYYILDYAINYFPKYKAALPYLKLSLFIGPLLIYKLGNTMHVLLRRNDMVLLLVVIGGFVQFGLLLVAHFLIEDEINRVLVAQFVSAIILLTVSILLNKRAISQYHVNNK